MFGLFGENEPTPQAQVKAGDAQPASVLSGLADTAKNAAETAKGVAEAAADTAKKAVQKEIAIKVAVGAVALFAVWQLLK